MMNPECVEVEPEFHEDREVVRCWTYIASHWRNAWLKRLRKDWQDFLRNVRAARREGQVTNCPNPECQMLVPPASVWHNHRMPPRCGFCDRFIQPYPANPRNRDLFNRFIVPELERRKIANPFV